MSDSDYTSSPTDTVQHEARDGRRKFTMIYHDDLVVMAELGPSALMVYSFLAKYANYSDGKAFPSIDTLATDCNLSRNTVMKAVRDLESVNLLRVTKKQTPHGFKRSIYTVLSKTDTPRSKKSTELGSKSGPSLVQNLDHNDNQVNKNQLNENQLDSASDDASLSPKPYDLLLAMCEQLNVDPNDLPPRDKSRQLGVAKRLVSDKATPQDITNITRWLQGQAWITGGIDMILIEKQKGQWILAGKPDGTQRPLSATQSHGNPKRDSRYLDPAELLARAAQLEAEEDERTRVTENPGRTLDRVQHRAEKGNVLPLHLD